MRLKPYDERDGRRVWLSESELQLLIDEADDGAYTLACMLAGRAGLRRQEIVGVRPVDVVERSDGQAIRVREAIAKHDQYREVPLPARLGGITHTATDAETPLVDVDTSNVYRGIRRAAERCREETGDDGWQHVGPHDLRRSWGVGLLEAGVLPSVVMQWGGWQDWDTFRDHYLAEFSPTALRRERGKVAWLQGGGASDDSGTTVISTPE